MSLIHHEGLAVADTYQVASAVNAAATVTLPAPGERLRWCIVGLSISASGGPAAAVSLTVTDGAATIERLEIPATAFAPIISGARYRCGANNAVTVTLPALGASVRGTVSVRALKLPA